MRQGVFVGTTPVAADPSFPEPLREFLAQVETRHFWFQSRARLVADVVTARIGPEGWLELGCGAGYVLAEVARRYGGPCSGQDLSFRALEIARRRTRADLYLSSPQGLPVRDFAGVGLLDVIEHLDDDVAVLRIAASYLRPGGAVVVTVPAHGWLWSQVDEASGHRRRYSRRSLLTTLVAAGLEPELCRPFFGSLLPGLLARRVVRLRDDQTALRTFLRPPFPPLNAVLGALTEVERRLFALGIAPFGTSWLAVARGAVTGVSVQRRA